VTVLPPKERARGCSAVIPAKAGIQSSGALDPGSRRDDGQGIFRGDRAGIGRSSIALGLLLLALSLSACGKRNLPEPPAGQENTYPRPYPRV
jgi:hypothetical protein